MSRIPFVWRLRTPPEPAAVARLVEAFGVSEPIARVLAARGLTDETALRRFLAADIMYAGNPFLFPDMCPAVDLIRSHIEHRRRILVWGDRDADGVTSTALVVRTLRTLGAEPRWYIPQREGYGIQAETVRRLHGTMDLIITVDCGITARAELAMLRDAGVDVVVTDHHEPPPDTVAFMREHGIPVVNPFLEDYPGFRELAGVGVAWKLVWALLLSYDREMYSRDFVVVDVETTGLSPQTDEVCEVAAVRIRNFVPVGTFNTLVRPSRPIPVEASAIHGITDAMVLGAPEATAIAAELRSFIGSRVVVAHNAPFDVPFLNTMFSRAGVPPLDNPVLDTLAMAREQFPYRRHSLAALSREFLFEHPTAHRALADVQATIELYYYLYHARNTKLRFFLEDNLDLTCLGTVADIMPLVEENRIIVKRGLESFLKSRKPACRILAGKLARRTQPVTVENIAWYVTPVINAAGRMHQADVAVEFLVTDSESDARNLHEELLRINARRKTLQGENLARFRELVAEQCDLEQDLLLVVVADGLEHGVTGIVANHLMREFNRPVVLFIQENGTATGAGRSPETINLHEILRRLEHLYVRFGGHEHACGLTLAVENLPAFREGIRSIQREIPVTPPVLLADTEVRLAELDRDLAHDLCIVEPCGADNPYPIFLMRNLRVEKWRYIGTGDKFTQMVLGDGSGRTIEAVCWDMPRLGDTLRTFSCFDIAGELEVNDGSKAGYRLVVLDMQPVA